MKRQVKKFIGNIADSSFVAKRLHSYFANRCNILYCHYVGESKPYLKPFGKAYKLECFERDIGILKKSFEFVPLGKALSSNVAGKVAERPSITLTFDDGLDVIKEGLLQVLSYHKIQATMFVMTSCIDNRQLMWRHKLAAIQSAREQSVYVPAYNAVASRYGLPQINGGDAVLPPAMKWPLSAKERIVSEIWEDCKMKNIDDYLLEFKPYLSWRDLDTWIGAGHSVGLHTHTHVPCSRLNKEGIEFEVLSPARFLKTRLGLDSLSFSYPFGDRFTENIEKDLYEKGIFDSMLGIEKCSKKGTAPYRLGRVSLEGDIKYDIFGRALIGAMVEGGVL